MKSDPDFPQDINSPKLLFVTTRLFTFWIHRNIIFILKKCNSWYNRAIGYSTHTVTYDFLVCGFLTHLHPLFLLKQHFLLRQNIDYKTFVVSDYIYLTYYKQHYCSLTFTCAFYSPVHPLLFYFNPHESRVTKTVLDLSLPKPIAFLRPHMSSATWSPRLFMPAAVYVF